MSRQSRYFTVVRNLGKVRRPFGYLGRYGRDVSAGAEFIIKGLVEDQPDFNERKRQAYLRDAELGRTAVELIPAGPTSSPPGYPTDRLGQSC